MTPNWHRTYHQLNCPCLDCLIGYPAEAYESIIDYPRLTTPGQIRTPCAGNLAAQCILEWAAEHEPFTSVEVARAYGLSGSYVRSTLARMVAAGTVLVAGTDRHRTRSYRVAR